ncbi:Eisosome component PIL1/LSP1 family protein NDAI_0A04820 [Naumovozyma dairenensis CBS 421]|uniref:Sphingolipid long chain base-responsive protein PIL1 n=1 Tax=Naumovozyma dairenensis (strain ATCC 10597 / BCRC 20456 / CBS 421 / NBRC 0211 / NRRL Y-12639) TaxID=1071378 RepID=G0W4A0_NAUDC|nr:hypothetical protein NDAI_0A04820 [Naumovozyma dairenensis CBS 421]CCD22638.1 hypothetical protein NDAI_0A04820 [Naumovozyma dairenensis CBS 421]
MHKTYSLRTGKAPTASQLENPPPPRTSTKSRFFGKGGLAYNFRTKAAGSFGAELSRKISQLVKIDKNIMRSMEVASMERRDVATYLSQWGLENDDDVSDLTDKIGVLIYEISELDDQFIDRYDQYRLTMKSIRDIETSIQPSRDRKDKILDKIAFMKYKEPGSQKIEVLEQELVRAEAEQLVAEAQLSNITRSKMRAAFNYQFDATIEHSEKIALIAGYAKALLELLDDSPVTPGETRPAYDGYEASKQIIIDAETALNDWTLDSAHVKPTLSFKQQQQNQREYQQEQDQHDGYYNEVEEEEEEVDEDEDENEDYQELHDNTDNLGNEVIQEEYIVHHQTVPLDSMGSNFSDHLQQNPPAIDQSIPQV